MGQDQAVGFLYIGTTAISAPRTKSSKQGCIRVGASGFGELCVGLFEPAHRESVR